MSIERAKEYLRQYGMEDRVRETELSSATVELAAVFRLPGMDRCVQAEGVRR